MKLPFVSLVCFTALSAPAAQATVAALAEVAVPVRSIQTDDVCLYKQTMVAEYGIPLLSNLEAVFAPNKILHQVLGGTSSYRNINLLAEAGPITFSYNSDSYDASIWSYDIDLNFAAVTAALSSSQQGRQKAIDIAKLALIAVSETASLTHGERQYRLTLNLSGLPSQSGLTGSPVYAATRYPYTSSSPVIDGYKRELLGSDCKPL